MAYLYYYTHMKKYILTIKILLCPFTMFSNKYEVDIRESSEKDDKNNSGIIRKNESLRKNLNK